MGFVGGKKIRVTRSGRNGCTDLVICEETRTKRFLMFVDLETARRIMVISEDLLMKPHLQSKTWKMEETKRTVSVDIVPNRRDKSLVVKSETKDEKKWRRRVYIPEGRYGEGWLSLSRQIKDLLRKERERMPERPVVPEIVQVEEIVQPLLRIEPPEETEWRDLAWPRIQVQHQAMTHRLGIWENAMVCSVNRETVDWQATGNRLAEVVRAEGNFELFPFTRTQAVIMAGSPEEREVLCSANCLFDKAEMIHLKPWAPGVNTEVSLVPDGGWVGITGLPFHLWNEGTTTRKYAFRIGT